MNKPPFFSSLYLLKINQSQEQTPLKKSLSPSLSPLIYIPKKIVETSLFVRLYQIQSICYLLQADYRLSILFLLLLSL